MQREFLSAFALLQAGDDKQRAGFDFLLGQGQAPPGLGHLAEVVDPLARLDLLAQALLTQYKDYARAGSRREGGGLPQLYRSPAFQGALVARRQQMATLGLLPTLPDLAALPTGSFAIHLTFTLRTPYISKDDTGLHILDNPVRKDKVFGLPMVASTGWKGALRAALRETHGWDDEHPDLVRLCGAARDDETGQAGRLYFYPTFFTQLGLEVINPHDRQSNAGKQPIYFESVPAGAQGEFALLYVPFDRVGEDEAETRRQAVADLALVAEGIEALMTRTGFGAKTTVGCGVAEADFVKDGQGKSQALIRVKGIGSYRCRNFAGLRQAANMAAQKLNETAGGAQ
ncbi:MAG: RAMP superfamily CRISPR-associated protein [Halothiobacillaceae bacterium]